MNPQQRPPNNRSKLYTLPYFNSQGSVPSLAAWITKWQKGDHQLKLLYQEDAPMPIHIVYYHLNGSLRIWLRLSKYHILCRWFLLTLFQLMLLLLVNAYNELFVCNRLFLLLVHLNSVAAHPVANVGGSMAYWIFTAFNGEACLSKINSTETWRVIITCTLAPLITYLKEDHGVREGTVSRFPTEPKSITTDQEGSGIMGHAVLNGKSVCSHLHCKKRMTDTSHDIIIIRRSSHVKSIPPTWKITSIQLCSWNEQHLKRKLTIIIRT